MWWNEGVAWEAPITTQTLLEEFGVKSFHLRVEQIFLGFSVI